jgi:hypothetical protein
MPHLRRVLLTGGVLAALLTVVPGTATAGSVPAAATAGSVPAAATVRGTTLLGVSCTRASRCMAVGSRARTKTTTNPLAEVWTGGSWRILATPRPATARSSLLIEVSCRAASSCVAVGSSTNSANRATALAQAWNGTRWRLITPARPAGARSSELLDVSCTGSHGCMAVGDYRTRAGRIHPLSESWNGTGWRVLTTPDRRGAQAGILDGIFCGGSRCKAVGFFQKNASVLPGLAEAWSGTRWRVLAFPDPAGATFVDAQDVACGAASACVAVGLVTTPVPTSLTERWHSGSWHLVKAAVTSPAQAMLNGVSCPASARCVAVGESGDGPKLLAEAWNGTRWRVLKTPDPPAATSSFLNQVSCTGVSHCVAVGSRGSGKNASALAEIWNGTSWKVLKTPGPKVAHPAPA